MSEKTKLILILIAFILTMLLLMPACDKDCNIQIQQYKDSLQLCRQANWELEIMVLSCDEVITDLNQELDSLKKELEDKNINYNINCSYK